MVLDYYEKVSFSLSLCLFLFVSLRVFLCEFLSLIPSSVFNPTSVSFSSLCLVSPIFLSLPFSGSVLSPFVYLPITTTPPPATTPNAVLQIVYTYWEAEK